MKTVIMPSKTGGSLRSIASKSAAHRLLICAAFAEGETVIECEQINEDISATVRCLNALGAQIERKGASFHVSPLRVLNRGAVLDCGESGSTLRFLLPLTCMLGAEPSFLMHGRLPLRPLSPLREELEEGGISLSEIGSNPLVCKGKLQKNTFSIAGNVSSQFISGLLFALALTGEGGRVDIKGNIESEPYINITSNTLTAFGVKVIKDGHGYEIPKGLRLRSPRAAKAEGDWSNAAFPLCMGVLGAEAVTVTGLRHDSPQGDKRIIDVLTAMGAQVGISGDSITAYPSKLCGIEIDASQIPDLVPILATVASTARGRTVIYNAERLRIKESDRLSAVSHMLSALGADIRETEDGLVIEGVPSLTGGEISSFGDHRIAMSGAVAALRCQNDVIIDGSEAVAKSYPAFFEDMSTLGLHCKKI